MIARMMLVSVLGLAVVSGVRSADTTPDPNPAKPPEGTTEEGLEQMLRQMGYEYKVTGKVEEGRWYKVTVSRTERGRGTTVFWVELRLGTNGTMIWGHVPLSDLKSEHLANAAALQKLLELNDTMGPNAFRINPKTKRLFLSRNSDARDLTPARLRAHIDGLIDGCVKAWDDWDTDKWSAGEMK
jgi:hypothetical protein